MESELTVSGQLGIPEDKNPIEVPKPSKPSGEPPHYYVVEQQHVLPHTGEFQHVGYFMIGLLLLIVILMFGLCHKSKLFSKIA